MPATDDDDDDDVRNVKEWRLIRLHVDQAQRQFSAWNWTGVSL
jgi:hypothetical protein